METTVWIRLCSSSVGPRKLQFRYFYVGKWQFKTVPTLIPVPVYEFMIWISMVCRGLGLGLTSSFKSMIFSRKIDLGSKFSQKCVAMILLSPWIMSECIKTLLLVRTSTKHEKIMIFYLRSKIVDPIFEGSRQSQMSWSTRKKHFFITGSFLE